MKEYACVVDLKATCWPEPEPRPDGETVVEPRSEIIEIGAVMARLDDWTEVGSFSKIVRPKINPVLSDFCRGLTGISQAEVDRARGFRAVLYDFHDWISVFGGWSKIVFASWGVYDAAQLENDCELHRLTMPFDREHLNLKNAVATAMGRRPRGISKTLALIGLEFSGPQHRGLSDARNALRLAQAVKLVYNRSKEG